MKASGICGKAVVWGLASGYVRLICASTLSRAASVFRVLEIEITPFDSKSSDDAWMEFGADMPAVDSPPSTVAISIEPATDGVLSTCVRLAMTTKFADRSRDMMR